MAIHSSILAWKIPWTKQPGSTVHGVTRVRHNFSSIPPPPRQENANNSSPPLLKCIIFIQFHDLFTKANIL